MNVVTAIGYVVELGGFICAAVGLTKTWREHANGRPCLPPRLDRMRLWVVHRVLKRPRVHVLGVASAEMAAMSAHAVARVSRPLTDEMSTDERIAALQFNLDKVADLATQAHQLVHSEESARRAEAKALRTEMQQVRDSLAQQDSDMIVRGVPLAAFGIGLATVGLFLQAVGSF